MSTTITLDQIVKRFNKLSGDAQQDVTQMSLDNLRKTMRDAATAPKLDLSQSCDKHSIVVHRYIKHEDPKNWSENSLKNLDAFEKELLPLMKALGAGFAIAGGAVHRCLEKNGLNAIFGTNESFNDIDMFLYSEDKDVTSQKMTERLLVAVKKLDTLYNLDGVCVSQGAVTIFLQGKNGLKNIQLQFVLRCYKSMAEIVAGFDLQVAAMMAKLSDDGTGLDFLCTPTCTFLHQCGNVQVVDPTRQSPSTPTRYMKYVERNVALILPEKTFGKDPMFNLGNRSFGAQPFDKSKPNCVLALPTLKECYNSEDEANAAMANYSGIDFNAADLSWLPQYGWKSARLSLLRGDSLDNMLVPIFYSNDGNVDAKCEFIKCLVENGDLNAINDTLWTNFFKFVDEASFVVNINGKQTIYLKNVRVLKDDTDSLAIMQNLNKYMLGDMGTFEFNDFLKECLKKRIGQYQKQLVEKRELKQDNWIMKNPGAQHTSSIKPIVCDSLEEYYSGSAFKSLRKKRTHDEMSEDENHDGPLKKK